MHRFAQLAGFLGIVVLILGGVHFYLWLRLIHDPAWPPPWSRLATALCIALAVSQPSVFILSRALPPNASRIVLFMPYLWMGMALLAFAFVLAVDVVRGLALGGLFATGHGHLLRGGGVRLLISRGAALAVIATVLVATTLAVVTALGRPSVRRVRVELERLPPQLSGFTIAQLTDLHLGPTLGARWASRVVADTNALEPDLIVITGDLVDGSVTNIAPLVAPLRDLKAPHGVYFVSGNHEYYSGIEQWLPHLARLGIRVLENERVVIERGGASFDLAGVHDRSGARFIGSRYREDLPRALAGRDANRELVLLAHQPRVATAAAEAGVGLQLSGHTHGGQFWPWRYLVYLQQPYVSGLNRRGQTQVYVSDGTGFWGPAMRLGTRAEITLLTLVATRRP
jgi:predicted MPP superfamily phosphohydrolase